MGRSQDNNSKPGFPYEEYDQLDVPLGDLLRGERATAGKSLLDVERDLKIKATYIAAIENADLDAFSSRGFIAGYVRSYARYLGLDPEWTYERFSRESGFAGVHGFSARQAEAAKRKVAAAPGRIDPNDVIKAARVSFAPERERLFDRIEPGALGSILVLAAVVLGIGYGAWAILQDIQRLQFAPVDEAPETFAELDPVAGVRLPAPDLGAETGGLAVNEDGFDRLYRPQALDVPVLTPRDEPLATLDPDRTGALASRIEEPAPEPALAAAPELVPDSDVQVTERINDEVVIFAVRPSWIRVSTASGTTLWEGTLDTGGTYTVPATADSPRLQAGNTGSLYFALNGVTMGPVGDGRVLRDLEVTADAISENYVMADATADPDLPAVAALVLGGEDDNQ